MVEEKRHVGYWWGILKGRDYLGYLVVDGKIIHRWNINKTGCRVTSTGFI